jgi:tetratricopeptide (TPR) repeat protein
MALLGALVAAFVIIPGALVIAYETRSPCREAVGEEQWEQAITACRSSYEHDANERDLFSMIKALSRLQQDDEVISFSPLLLAGKYAGNIHRALAYILAINRKLPAEGRMHVAQAFAFHVISGDRIELLRDLEARADIERYELNYGAALGLDQTAVRLANDLGDVKEIVKANMILADIAYEMGAYKLAEDSLRVVEMYQSVLSAYEKVEFELKLGIMWVAESDSGQEGREDDALAAFRIADMELARCPSQPWGLESQIWLNLAAILSLRNLDAASVVLAKIDEVEKDLPDTLIWRASIAAKRRQFVEAAQYLRQAEARDKHDDDAPLRVARLRGNLAELMRDPVQAAMQYRLAIEMVDKNRRESGAEAGYILAGHRGAYDDLIQLLASKGRWTEALGVILSMDVSDMLHADYEEGLSGRSVVSLEGEIPSVQDVISAWRGRDLVIIVAPLRRTLGPDPNMAYRIRVYDGAVTGEPIGDAQELRSMSNKVGDMKDSKFADWANRIVPASEHGEPLSVLLVGPLSGLPLSALAGVANPSLPPRRTLVRAQSLLTRTPPARSTGGVAILADSDPQLPLPAAVAEADAVASVIKTGVAVYKSRDATFEQLVRHRGASVLHVATHVMTEGGQHMIHLANRDVNQMDIMSHNIAPRLVVLSGCGSAAAGDAEGWQSVAAAFLEAGTTYVVATAYNIEDAAGPIIMQEFYRQPDVFDEPAHALAMAQRNIIARATPEQLNRYMRSWLAYSVLARPPVIPAHSPAKN